MDFVSREHLTLVVTLSLLALAISTGAQIGRRIGDIYRRTRIGVAAADENDDAQGRINLLEGIPTYNSLHKFGTTRFAKMNSPILGRQAGTYENKLFDNKLPLRLHPAKRLRDIGENVDLLRNFAKTKKMYDEFGRAEDFRLKSGSGEAYDYWSKPSFRKESPNIQMKQNNRRKGFRSGNSRDWSKQEKGWSTLKPGKILKNLRDSEKSSYRYLEAVSKRPKNNKPGFPPEPENSNNNPGERPMSENSWNNPENWQRPGKNWNNQGNWEKPENSWNIPENWQGPGNSLNSPGERPISNNSSNSPENWKEPGNKGNNQNNWETSENSWNSPENWREPGNSLNGPVKQPMPENSRNNPENWQKPGNNGNNQHNGKKPENSLNNPENWQEPGNNGNNQHNGKKPENSLNNPENWQEPGSNGNNQGNWQKPEMNWNSPENWQDSGNSLNSPSKEPMPENSLNNPENWQNPGNNGNNQHNGKNPEKSLNPENWQEPGSKGINQGNWQKPEINWNYPENGQKPGINWNNLANSNNPGSNWNNQNYWQKPVNTQNWQTPENSWTYPQIWQTPENSWTYPQVWQTPGTNSNNPGNWQNPGSNYYPGNIGNYWQKPEKTQNWERPEINWNYPQNWQTPQTNLNNLYNWQIPQSNSNNPGNIVSRLNQGNNLDKLNHNNILRPQYSGDWSKLGSNWLNQDVWRKADDVREMGKSRPYTLGKSRNKWNHTGNWIFPQDDHSELADFGNHGTSRKISENSGTPYKGNNEPEGMAKLKKFTVDPRFSTNQVTSFINVSNSVKSESSLDIPGTGTQVQEIPSKRGSGIYRGSSWHYPRKLYTPGHNPGMWANLESDPGVEGQASTNAWSNLNFSTRPENSLDNPTVSGTPRNSTFNFGNWENTSEVKQPADSLNDPYIWTTERSEGNPGPSYGKQGTNNLENPYTWATGGNKLIPSNLENYGKKPKNNFYDSNVWATEGNIFNPGNLANPIYERQPGNGMNNPKTLHTPGNWGNLGGGKQSKNIWKNQNTQKSRISSLDLANTNEGKQQENIWNNLNDLTSPGSIMGNKQELRVTPYVWNNSGSLKNQIVSIGSGSTKSANTWSNPKDRENIGNIVEVSDGIRRKINWNNPIKLGKSMYMSGVGNPGGSAQQENGWNEPNYWHTSGNSLSNTNDEKTSKYGWYNQGNLGKREHSFTIPDGDTQSGYSWNNSDDGIKPNPGNSANPVNNQCKGMVTQNNTCKPIVMDLSGYLSPIGVPVNVGYSTGPWGTAGNDLSNQDMTGRPWNDRGSWGTQGSGDTGYPGNGWTDINIYPTGSYDEVIPSAIGKNSGTWGALNHIPEKLNRRNWKNVATKWRMQNNGGNNNPTKFFSSLKQARRHRGGRDM